MWDKPSQLNLAAAVLTVLAAGLFFSAMISWAARLPAFAIKRVMVRGELIEVNPLHLEAVIREGLRGTFFTIDLAQAQRAFGGVPWVRSASVRRQWPNRLEVDIVEHRALARWNESALVNTEGEVFRADFDDELPVFRGPDGSAGEVALNYLQFRDALKPLAMAPAEVNLSPRRAWQLKLDNGMVMELGREHVGERLARWVAQYTRSVARLPQPVAYVDLRYRNGFAVRLGHGDVAGARGEPGARRG